MNDRVEAWLVALFCTLERVPGVILRYLPFRKVITLKQKKMLFGIYMVMFLLNFLLFWIIWENREIPETFYRKSFAIFGIVMVIVNICVIRGRFWEHLFTAGLNMSMVIMSIIIAGALANIIETSSVFRMIIFNAGLTCVICLIAFPLFSYLIVNTITPFLSTDNNYYWNKLAIVPWLIYIACISVLPVKNTLLSSKHVVTVVLLNGAAVGICYCIGEDFKRIQEHNLSVQMLNRQKEYYGQLVERVEEARKIRHDFKNHLMAIRGFINRDDKEGLGRYCDEMQMSQNSGIAIPYTGNSAVDGVVYHYMQQAQEHGIRFRMSGMFGKNGIADMDLCVLLGNALENAIAACCQIEKERFIDLNVRMDGSVLAIMIQNSFDGVVLEDDGKIFSRKRGNRMGVGLKSIKDICKKYHGIFEVKYEGTEFSCLMLLNEQKKP